MLCVSVSGSRFDFQPAGGEAACTAPLALPAVPWSQWNCPKDQTCCHSGEHHWKEISVFYFFVSHILVWYCVQVINRSKKFLNRSIWSVFLVCSFNHLSTVCPPCFCHWLRMLFQMSDNINPKRFLFFCWRIRLFLFNQKRQLCCSCQIHQTPFTETAILSS